VAKHKVLTWFLAGSYLLAVRGKEDHAARQQAEYYLRKAVDESVHASSFQLSSSNSYVESTLARIFLERGDRQRAEELCKSAISHLEHNWGAWRILGDVYKLDGEWPKAIDCYITAAEGRRDRTLLKRILGMAQRWKKERKISAQSLSRVQNRIAGLEQGSLESGTFPAG